MAGGALVEPPGVAPPVVALPGGFDDPAGLFVAFDEPTKQIIFSVSF